MQQRISARGKYYLLLLLTNLKFAKTAKRITVNSNLEVTCLNQPITKSQNVSFTYKATFLVQPPV